MLNHRTGGVDRRSTARLDAARRPLSLVEKSHLTIILLSRIVALHSSLLAWGSAWRILLLKTRWGPRYRAGASVAWGVRTRADVYGIRPKVVTVV